MSRCSENLKSPASTPIIKDRKPLVSVFILSAAAFLYQVALTRLFPITHFYHFAFMIIALALLGGGASGTFLSLQPRVSQLKPRLLCLYLSLGCAASILGSFILTNRLPFDTYALAIDHSQFLILLLHFFSMATPFFCVGLLVSALMRKFGMHSHIIYAVNLAGSSCGCLLAPVLLYLTGGVGVVMIGTCLACISVLLVIIPTGSFTCRLTHPKALKHLPALLTGCALMVFTFIQALILARGGRPHALLEIYISPYKALSYALQYPGSQIIDSNWNAFSRVDVVRSGGIRSLPGLSYLYDGTVESQAGVFVDGADLHALLPLDTDASIFSFLPQSLAYYLRPNAQVLILGSHAGQDVLTAKAGGVRLVTAVEPNRLLTNAASSIYNLPGVRVEHESPRVFLKRTHQTYDVIVLPLTNSYYPITSGTYSLSEEYRYTIESIQEAVAHLNPSGILVINRWLQMPPSEFLRVFILAVEALEQDGLDASLRLAAIRGYNMGTLFISPSSFSQSDLDVIRQFSEQRAFDLVHLPGLQAHEANRFNRLQEDVYFENFRSYLDATNRAAWLRAYPYRVDPPSDDHPFFMHFYKWSQVSQVMQAYGKTWQPFGGAGILVMFFLLTSMLILSFILVVVPLIPSRLCRTQKNRAGVYQALHVPFLGYFLVIGVGFMMVEIPVMQRFILYLGQPEYAMSIVLFTLLFTSGIGSRYSDHAPPTCLVALFMLILLMPFWITWIFNLSMAWSFPLRILVAILCLSPIGFLMGLPLAKGMKELNRIEPQLVAWAWAINGSASVVASVLAALVALTINFSAVLLVGALCYLLAYVFLQKISRLERVGPICN